MGRKKKIDNENVSVYLSPGGMNYEPLLVIQGDTILQAATMRQIKQDFASYIWNERTGIMGQVSWVRGKGFQTLPLANFFKAARIDPFENEEAALQALEKDLKEYLKNPPITRGAKVSEVDQAFTTAILPIVHSLFTQYETNSMPLEALVFNVSMNPKVVKHKTLTLGEKSAAWINDQIRAYARSQGDNPTFDITRGAGAKITRLRDEQGKKTGEKVEHKERAARGSKTAGKTFRRYSGTVAAIATAEEFEKAKRALNKDEITLVELGEWQRSHRG